MAVVYVSSTYNDLQQERNAVCKAMAMLLFAETLRLALERKEWELSNEICWSGSIHGFTKLVLPACEQVVAIAPETWKDMIKDSRGLARAMTGDTTGSIEDFTAAVKPIKDLKDMGVYDAAFLQRREDWITALKEGRIDGTSAGDGHGSLLQDAVILPKGDAMADAQHFEILKHGVMCCSTASALSLARTDGLSSIAGSISATATTSRTLATPRSRWPLPIYSRETTPGCREHGGNRAGVLLRSGATRGEHWGPRRPEDTSGDAGTARCPGAGRETTGAPVAPEGKR